MTKQKVSAITAFLGIVAIILTSVTMSYAKLTETEDEEILKDSIKIATKNCYIDKKCKKGKILITKLESLGYISDDIKEKLNNYEDVSYVNYPSLEVILVRKEIEK